MKTRFKWIIYFVHNMTLVGDTDFVSLEQKDLYIVLEFFGKIKLAQKMVIKCWRNWRTVRKKVKNNLKNCFHRLLSLVWRVTSFPRLSTCTSTPTTTRWKVTSNSHSQVSENTTKEYVKDVKRRLFWDLFNCVIWQYFWWQEVSFVWI